MEKICKKCGELRTEFHRDSRYPDGLRTWCKPCVNVNSQQWYFDHPKQAKEARSQYYFKNKEAHKVRTQIYKKNNRIRLNFKERLRGYNLTEEQYNEILIRQGGKCAIAGCPELDNLVIDHDHSCCPGQESCGRCVRGLLCALHNYGLGYFKDNLQCLQGAIDYLKNRRKTLDNDSRR